LISSSWVARIIGTEPPVSSKLSSILLP
jgi:hypothetical protein